MNIQDSIHHVRSARRILVLGSSGSGKTTLTLRLARALNIEPIHLDARFWRPGWVSTPQSEWREVVRGLIRQESWIMDGTYESTLDLRIPAADAAIVLERSRLTCLWNVLQRKASIDDDSRPDAPAGQKLDLAFLRYIWNYPKVTRPFVFDCIQQYGQDKPLIPIRGAGEAERFIQAVEQELPVPPT